MGDRKGESTTGSRKLQGGKREAAERTDREAKCHPEQHESTKLGRTRVRAEGLRV